MSGRLFLKIYLTFLGGLLVLALSFGLVVMVTSGGDGGAPGWHDRRDALLAAVFSVADEAGEVEAMVERLGPELAADITVFAPDGRVLASFGPVIAWPGHADRRHTVATLPDGKLVVARFRGSGGPPRGGPLFLLAFVTGVTALVAWPVVRHLTRRLERLRHGVDAWGKGELALRVPEEGRDEIAAVAASFNRAASQVEALVASHRSLLANASHELRSPIARLRMAVDLHDADPASSHRDEILRNLAELDELVGEILLASRLDHGASPGPMEEVDLLPLAAEEAARARASFTGEASPVAGDPRLLVRLMRNLIQNARRHGAPPVEVALRRASGAVELSVRDHGAGIPASEGERVFEPFYRPQGHGESDGGWGLGLALVRQIATLHGATVRHETPAGGGACFVVSFPPLPQGS